ncbi:hypothetical protein N1851_002846 [Merluccius polli]|uniref:Uncharacterized protein n=1 Tax=Merluccius polli TaxID=89951 RepID=A0AA47NAC5_MERPO|nr:hypothetical protein N1851_002846 [Merluccius polli]
MAPVAKKAESFVWTDCEVELLLRLTLDYKANKLQENVDWESCQSKYLDLANAFRAQCPTEATEDFPHAATAVSKVQVTTKLKNICGKYRRAVDTGRRSGQGRVVMLFYELCQEIWGGSPATRSIESSIETADLEDDSSSQPSTSTEEMPASPHSTDSIDCLPPAVVKQRRDLLQAKLASHRGDRLKRKAHADPAEEELKIKRRTLELAEESARSHAEHMTQINTNIANITSTIQDGFALMRELLLRLQFVPPPKQQRTIPWVPTIICSYDTTTHYTSLSAHTCTQSIPIPTCTIPTYSNTQPSD